MAEPFFCPTPDRNPLMARAFFEKFRYDPLMQRIIGSETSWQTTIRD
jgi:hypothetical protein